MAASAMKDAKPSKTPMPHAAGRHALGRAGRPPEPATGRRHPAIAAARKSSTSIPPCQWRAGWTRWVPGQADRCRCRLLSTAYPTLSRCVGAALRMCGPLCGEKLSPRIRGKTDAARNSRVRKQAAAETPLGAAGSLRARRTRPATAYSPEKRRCHHPLRAGRDGSGSAGCAGGLRVSGLGLPGRRGLDRGRTLLAAGAGSRSAPLCSAGALQARLRRPARRWRRGLGLLGASVARRRSATRSARIAGRSAVASAHRIRVGFGLRRRRPSPPSPRARRGRPAAGVRHPGRGRDGRLGDRDGGAVRAGPRARRRPGRCPAARRARPAPRSVRRPRAAPVRRPRVRPPARRPRLRRCRRSAAGSPPCLVTLMRPVVAAIIAPAAPTSAPRTALAFALRHRRSGGASASSSTSASASGASSSASPSKPHSMLTTAVRSAAFCGGRLARPTSRWRSWRPACGRWPAP